MTIDLKEEAFAEGSEEHCEEFDVDVKGKSVEDKQGKVPMDCDASLKEDFVEEETINFPN